MKVLSVENPLSYLICSGIKQIENRTWKTKHRGTFLIHSSGKFTDNQLKDYDLPEFIFSGIQEKLKKILKKGDSLTEKMFKSKDLGFNDLEKKLLSLQFYAEKNSNENYDFFQNRAIIGSVDLVDIDQFPDHPFSIEGQLHWKLENPKLFKNPILLVKGKLGLWNYDLTDQLKKQITEIIKL